jgi:hypothetical protein
MEGRRRLNGRFGEWKKRGEGRDGGGEGSGEGKSLRRTFQPVTSHSL